MNGNSGSSNGNNTNSNNINSTSNNSPNNQGPKVYHQGRTPKNFYGRLANPEQQTQLSQNFKQIAEKRAIRKKKEAAKKGLSAAAGAVGGPVAQGVTKAMLNSPAGERYIDAYNQGTTQSEKIENVRKLMKKDIKKIKIIGALVLSTLSIIILLVFVSFFFKTVDSQTYSNENEGTYKSENYIGDDKVVNIFANYPKLYEKVVETANKVSDQYQIEIDKYLIIATLVEPIANELIIPVNDKTCGEDDCYYFKGESKTWSEFLEAWADQTELLAKMQILTYINNEGDIKVNCGSDQTMEQYAQNDLETNTFPWYGWLNPVNWFKGFRDAAGAEVNAKCVTARNGESKVPTVRMLSIEQGTYYVSYDKNKKVEYEKDPESGGVYFWNLINKNGFIHEYLKDYLSESDSNDPDENYEINKKVIVDTVNDIYSYYETIRKDCNGYPVIKGELKKIKFQEKKGDPVYTLDFEDMFVGGSVLATYGGATGEVAIAQAIITRSEAYNYIVERNQDVIVGTAKMGCWWQKYNPTYNPEIGIVQIYKGDPEYDETKDPSIPQYKGGYDPEYPKEHYPEIYKAVTETRGIVVTKYSDVEVLETEYDAFCPTTSEPKGGFYYLPDDQRNLPIEVSKFSVPQSRVECPCFQNASSRPGTQFSERLADLTNKPIGKPAQKTSEACWESVGTSTYDENGDENFDFNYKTDDDGNLLFEYKYKPTGGHGRGVSQHGMKYFSQFGYDAKAMIKLFLERDTYGISFKRYDDSIEENECINHGYYNRGDEGEEGGSSSSSSYEGGNYTKGLAGTPLNTTLVKALSKKGHTLQELTNCIQERIDKAGPGTRAGVVEAGAGLIQCTYDLTGGYTYPYSHSGADPANMKGLINPSWGNYGSSKLGLNCATFVRVSFCNGGMNMCNQGSRFAHEMFDKKYFPGATKVLIAPTFKYVFGNIKVSSASEAFNLIKPGDVLYSEHYPRIEEKDHGNHVMLVVGKTDSSITIAENGWRMRVISKSEIISPKSHQYGVLLLDDYYGKSSSTSSQKAS